MSLRISLHLQQRIKKASADPLRESNVQHLPKTILQKREFEATSSKYPRADECYCSEK